MITKNYIAEIKAVISIHASQRTTNILEGTYKSIYKGRNIDFEDLREYVIGDDIKDIDWKSSARSGSVLIKRCNAENKHNIMFVLDTGKKMQAHTKAAHSKSEISLMSTGVIAYLAYRNGDYIGSAYIKDKDYVVNPLKCGLNNLEKILYAYEKDIGSLNTLSIEDILTYISNNSKKRMIIFVITDIEGMESVTERTLRTLSRWHDLMFVNVSDADMMGEKVYDLDKDSYIPSLILKDSKLQLLEQQEKMKVYASCLEKFKRYKVTATTIDTSQEIPQKITDLLARHKHANIR